jgi:hypothetical protein
MKTKNLALLFIVFFSFTVANAQSIKPTPEQKQMINPIIDEGFTQWSDSWSYDKYISRSALINSISIDENYGDLLVTGVFTYKRLLSSFEGTFTAKINSNGKLINIKYTDADGLKGSKSF